MPPERGKLTPEVHAKICSFIRSGGDPHVAAEAAGVPATVFEEWLRIGQKRRARRVYRDFWREVEQARAEARLSAELKAFTSKPLDWLRCGPGKETPERPGWTGVARPAYQADASAANCLQTPEFQAFVQLLRRVLGPFPEALAALTQALEQEITIEMTTRTPAIPRG